MNHRFLFLIGYPILWFVIWSLLGIVSVGMQPPLPVFELPILAQAWDMWQHDAYLLPSTIDGHGEAIYPLYLWMIHGTWALFGVSEVWPRILPFALGFSCTLMIAALSRALWPGWPGLGVLSATLAVGMSCWVLATALSGETALMVLCVVTAMYGLVTAWRHGTWDGLVLIGLGLGAGFLTGGYSVLVHVLPVMLLTPLWAPGLGWRDPDGGTRNGNDEGASVSWRHWYGRLAVSLLIALAVAAAWIIPLIVERGFSAVDGVLLQPIINLLSGDAIWARQWWLYLVLVLLFIFPWLVWPPAWRAVTSVWSMIKDGGGRFCLLWLVPTMALYAVAPGVRPLDVAMHIPVLAMIGAYLLYLRMDLEMARQETERRFGNGEATLGLLIALSGFALIIAPLAGGLVALPWWIEGLSGAWGIVLVLIAAVTAYAAPRMIIFRASLVSCQMVLVVLIGIMAISPLLIEKANVAPAARHVRQALDRDISVAIVGPYGHEFDFLARLESPLNVLDPNDSIGIVAWAAGHPGGEIAVISTDLPPREQAEAVFPFLDQYLVFWPADIVSKHPYLVVDQGDADRETTPE